MDKLSIAKFTGKCIIYKYMLSADTFFIPFKVLFIHKKAKVSCVCIITMTFHVEKHLFPNGIKQYGEESASHEF